MHATFERLSMIEYRNARGGWYAVWVGLSGSGGVFGRSASSLAVAASRWSGSTYGAPDQLGQGDILVCCQGPQTPLIRGEQPEFDIHGFFVAGGHAFMIKKFIAPRKIFLDYQNQVG